MREPLGHVRRFGSLFRRDPDGLFWQQRLGPVGLVGMFVGYAVWVTLTMTAVSASWAPPTSDIGEAFASNLLMGLFIAAASVSSFVWSRRPSSEPTAYRVALSAQVRRACRTGVVPDQPRSGFRDALVISQRRSRMNITLGTVLLVLLALVVGRYIFSNSSSTASAMAASSLLLALLAWAATTAAQVRASRTARRLMQQVDRRATARKPRDAKDRRD